jgi:excisionase family DNA binding protein
MATTMTIAELQPTRTADAAELRRPLTREEVMTASEVAELLHLPVSTVYELARKGELPASRLGRTWRFGSVRSSV